MKFGQIIPSSNTEDQLCEKLKTPCSPIAEIFQAIFRTLWYFRFHGGIHTDILKA